jgi:uncharacterized membrane protein YbaN (DUF454 family)
MHPAKRNLFVVLGAINVALGVLGMLLPLLPTTPFLLLAAYLFARGSENCHRWLLQHRVLGPYIHAFRNKTGLTRSQKLRIAASFTAMLGISVYFAPLDQVRAGLVALWLVWIVVLFRLKSATMRSEPDSTIA